MDERMAERRRRLRTGRRRLRLRRTLVVSGLVAVVAVAAAIDSSGLVALAEIRVEGTRRLDPAQVRRAAALPLGTSTLRVRLGPAERRVEALPQVEDAELRRSDPLTVVITVHERRPVAVVEAAGRNALIDAQGVISARGSEPSLPVIVLPPGGPLPVPGTEAGDVPGLAAAHTVLTGLPGPLRAMVTRYEVHGDALELVLSSGVRVRFGGPEQVAEKARALGVVLEDVAGRRVRVIDVRAPGHPAVAG